MKADTAYRLACEGTALLWRGDFHNARQLLQAMGRRIDRKPSRRGDSPADSFRLHRRARSHRARVLGRLLVLLEDDYNLVLRRAPDVRQACAEAYGPQSAPMAVSLTELLGVTGAHQWRTKGVEVPALDARIHPHYGVFSPVRGEYVDLVARAPLPAPADRRAGRRTAFDLGYGDGSARRRPGPPGDRPHRGHRHQPACPGLRARQRPPTAPHRAHRHRRSRPLSRGRADLVVCNPPWIPARPTSAVEQGVYDSGGSMLRTFLDGLPAHLEPGGEGWLILSDLAEHLGLQDAGRTAGGHGSSGPARGGQDRHQAPAPTIAGQRRQPEGRSPACGAGRGDHVAVAAGTLGSVSRRCRGSRS